MRKLILVAIAAVLSGPAAFASVNIELSGGVFRVTGWDAGLSTSAAEPAGGWVSVFPVYAGEGDVPPLLGSYAVSNHVLEFHPRFPIAAGVHYRAVFNAPNAEHAAVPIEARFDGPPRASNPLTRVDRIYPSSDVFPSNTLRFYIYFSAPMSRGEAYQHIHLVDADNNKEIEIPFLELEQELWDQSNQRLTVLFDPGRIKRGLVPTDTIGPPVVEGKHYRLVIDADWHDARGVHLIDGFTKAFAGGPADRHAADPKKWAITAPKAGTLDALVVDFPQSMDYVLLQRMIGIFDANGEREIQGKIAVVRSETEWRFTPREPWKPGGYKITADNTLEDVSGNHLDKPFDVDLFDKVTGHIATRTSSLAFTVR